MCVCMCEREREREQKTDVDTSACRSYMATALESRRAGSKERRGAVKREKRIGNRGRVCQGGHCIHRRRLTRSTNEWKISIFVSLLPFTFVFLNVCTSSAYDDDVCVRVVCVLCVWWCVVRCVCW